MPSLDETARFVDEWYKGTKEWEASGGVSTTEHLIILLTAVLSSVDWKHIKREGYTPLHTLARRKKWKRKKTRCFEEKGLNMLGSVRLLQKCGIDIDTKSGHNAPCRSGRTPLHLAAKRGHFDLVKGLVGAGANVNVKCENRRTALSFAAGGDHPLILRYLMRHGAEVEGSQPLHQAAYVGSPESVEALLKAGAKPNERDGDGYTAAQKCCIGGGKKKGGRAKALALLLKGGADVQVKNVDDLTLLHLAARDGNAQCIPVLLERGLQLDARTEQKHTPLRYACFNGRLACVKELLRRGASLDAAYDGRTPLMSAVLKGHVAITSELIGAGASVHAKTNHSLTALHLAAALGSMEMAYLLVEGGADVSALAENQETPLMTCMRPDDSKVCEPLMGAKFSPGAKEARERVAAFLLKMGATVDGKIIALAGEKGFGDVLASFFSTKSDKMDALSDRLDTVAEHYSVTADSDDERADDVVQVRLVNKATGERGGKHFALSIPLVEQLMKKVTDGGEGGAEEGTKSAGNGSCASGILPTLLDPAKYGYKSGKKGKGKGKGKKEVELEYDGVNFTEEGFEAVVKFVTTGSVEELLTRRPGSAGKRKRGTNYSSGSGEGKDVRVGGGASSNSSSGGVRKECPKLFDGIRAKQALQAAEFFCLEGLSREVKALMSEYGFALPEETGGGARAASTQEGQPLRKRRRANP